MNRIIIFLLALFLGGCDMNIPKVPLEDFFKNPEKSSFQLSPNGQKIAYMKPWEEGNRMMNVYIKTIGTNEEKRITNASNRSLYGYFWRNEDRIAYIQDKGGDENIHIYAVNIDGTNDLDLTPFENIQARIIDDLEQDTDHMIVSINNRDPRVHDVYRLNVNTGELDLIA